MPGQIRSDSKAMKLAYSIMKTPKNMRQDKNNKTPERTIEAWMKDRMTSQ